MVLGKLPVPGRPAIWIRVGQGHITLAVGAGGGCLDIFSLVYHFSFLSPSLRETARYRLKYYLKGPLTQNNQPTNQSPLSEKFCCQNLITSIEVINMTGHSSKSNKLRNINTIGCRTRNITI